MHILILHVVGISQKQSPLQIIIIVLLPDGFGSLYRYTGILSSRYNITFFKGHTIKSVRQMFSFENRALTGPFWPIITETGLKTLYFLFVTNTVSW